MSKAKPKFAPGDKVFAKVRGYPPWPAKIEGLADETPNKMRYHVYFYGTGETAVIKAEDVFAFVENKVKFGKPKKQKYFQEALLQIEAELSPEEVKKANDLIEKQATDSSTNSINSDTPKPASLRRSSTSAKPAKLQQSAQPNNAATSNSKPKEKKRKAEDMAEESETTKKLRSSSSISVIEADTTTNKISAEVMSRSGRKIKPKRFADFDDGSGDDAAKPKSGKTKDDEDDEEEADDYLIARINDTDHVKIPLKLNRPDFYDVKNAEVWDDMVLKYANSLKKRIESEEDKQKFDFLHTESQLLEIDINIKSALNLQKAHPEKCLVLLDKLSELKITPLMLKKHPDLVHTIKKMRKYVGNVHRWNMNEEELAAFREKAGRIRVKSEHIYNKFKNLFLNPDINNFWEFFNKEVERFQEKTRSLTLHQLFSIVQEPE
ncbi:hypothetical protein O3M35_008715 [Rhynocoris fuscipes]|uniref:PWWP domain-containing protein n=1 Tax=Rhynocoris fuscipes TaxID=488301 RepID=A0AAW1D785_9HEMI